MEPDRDRRRASLPEPGLGAGAGPALHGARRPGRRARCRTARTRPARAAAIRAAAHRTLRDVTADYEAFHFNTMVAKLMELTNTLFRYRGSPVAGGAEWDEAIRLLLLMLAPAAPHITEELWSRRLAAAGEAWSSIHTERWPEVDQPASPNRPARSRSRSTARSATGSSCRSARPARRSRRRPGVARIQELLAGRTPDRVIQAGGGKLVNLVGTE